MNAEYKNFFLVDIYFADRNIAPLLVLPFCMGQDQFLGVFDGAGEQLRLAGSAASCATAVRQRNAGSECGRQHVLAGRHANVVAARLDVNVKV